MRRMSERTLLLVNAVLLCAVSILLWEIRSAAHACSANEPHLQTESDTFSDYSLGDKILDMFRSNFDAGVKENQELVERMNLPSFTVPGPARIAVELTIPRSGSTFTTALFSIIEGAFVLAEPYQKWDTGPAVPDDRRAASSMPSVSQLLDCSFIDSSAVADVFWVYACRNAQWIVRDNQLYKQCVAGALSVDLIRHRCSSATLVLSKIARVPKLISAFGAVNLIPQDIKVFMLVRAPWEVFRSQYRAGWLTDPLLPFASSVPADVDPVAFHTNRICDHMLQNVLILQARPKANQLLVRYEDLLSDFDNSVLKLFEFVGIELTPAMRTALDTIRQHKFAAFKTVKQMTSIEAYTATMNSKSCHGISSVLGYLQFEEPSF